MSDSISNISSIPTTHPVKPVRKPSRDRESDKQEPGPQEPGEQDDDGNAERSPGSVSDGDQKQPLLDEYV